VNSIDEISDMFDIESQKLHNLINIASTKPNLSIHEIVETYYQIMNMSSMITMLKKQIGIQHNSLHEKILEIEKLISDKFNSRIHPQIMDDLSQSIRDTTKTLQSEETGQKSKDEIENEAKLYEDLREKMSTKEFVEQYEKGL
jgi:hypothetical protein